MWRFKASKFKNAAPKVPKRDEWIVEISAGNASPSYSNHIQASAVYMAFDIDSGGVGNLGILPVSAIGRQSIPAIRAHTENVTDFKFSPFNDCCLATSSQDGTVKIWQLPAQVDIEQFSVVNPLTTLSVGGMRVETVTWHSTVSELLVATTGQSLSLFDVNAEKQITCLEGHEDQIQSCSWHVNGSILVTSCKDKKIRILDPRAQSTVVECSGHHNMRDSRVIWLGDKDLILSSGFDALREREVCLRDTRNMTSPLSRKSFGTSSGVMIPAYDSDSCMLFMGGKGDSYLRYLEVTEKDLLENSTDSVEQIVGLCLVPKRSLDVMTCEVNRVLILSQHAVLPVPYFVPRKYMSDFHEDLFPPTNSTIPALSIEDWLANKNGMVQKVSLDPSAKENLVSYGATPRHESQPMSEKQASYDEPMSEAENRPRVEENPSADEQKFEKPSVTMREKKNVFSAGHQSKFRHLEGVQLHKSQNIENIRHLSPLVPGESDMFQANAKFCAFPLEGSGGLVAVIKIDEPGRLPDTGVPSLQNGCQVSDFVWDPFDDYKMAVACDDAKIKLWKIPEDGLTETLTEPEMCLHGHTEKVYFVRYHPLASGVLASGSYDMTVRIWDLETASECIQLEGHTDTIFCLSWSTDGTKCATVCKDGFIRIYDPRHSVQPVQTGPVPAGTRGARVVWAREGKLLLVIGFEKSRGHSIRVYSSDDLTKLLHKEDLDISPGILVPHYDEDSSTLFITGRGESIVRTYEVSMEEPYLFPLSHHKCDGLHQALAFLPKKMCDVTKVEFAKALRLTSSSIEPLAFIVPRIKTQYFQDDIFPDTKVTWQPSVTSSEWFSGIDRPLRRISMRPENMRPLSEIPAPAPKPKKFESYKPDTFKSDEQKKEELLNAMLGKFDLSNEPLPQDLTEGVEEDEWDD